MVLLPLYSDSQKRIHTIVIMGAIVGMTITGFIISYFKGSGSGTFSLSPAIQQQLISFTFLFLGFYLTSSYLFFQILVVERDKNEFSIGRKIFGKIIRVRTFKINEAKEVVMCDTPIKSVFSIFLKLKSSEILLMKGDEDFVLELSKKISSELGAKFKKGK